ncbi:MAG TPA: zinc ribbon domain-containing protein [Pyrinomonadaceae bacterium]|nr:zinc ribbon domain-containing protein [Pyrinomonadaceae bacterium]
MFCPKCAAQNIDGASFCRVCGANISLVPQALTGRLPQPAPTAGLDSRGRRRRQRDEDRPATLERGIVKLFVGLGFIAAALAVMFRFPGGFTWGWALFIPAFSSIGKGIAQIVAVRQSQAARLPSAGDNSRTFAQRPLNSGATVALAEPLTRPTGELLPSPPSVTEGTTRHLGAEAPTKHLDSGSELQK